MFFYRLSVGIYLARVHWEWLVAPFNSFSLMRRLGFSLYISLRFFLRLFRNNLSRTVTECNVGRKDSRILILIFDKRKNKKCNEIQNGCAYWRRYLYTYAERNTWKILFPPFFFTAVIYRKKKRKITPSVSIDSKFEISVQRGKLIWTVQPGIWTLDRCIN